MTTNVVTVPNLGNDFDIGVIEANKIHVKIDGTTIVRDGATGVIAVNPAALATTNALTNPSDARLTSTVNGVAATLDLTPLIQAGETNTTLTYDPATKTLTYTNEDGTVATIDLSALAADLFVSGGSYDPATMVLTLSDNDGTTPDMTINLADLKKVTTQASQSISFTGTGEASSPLQANLVVDPMTGNLITVGPAGAKVDPATVTALATVDVQDAFGVHQFYAFA